MPWFPDDETGEMLRKMVERGDSLERERDIHFHFIFINEERAHEFVAMIKHRGYQNSDCHHWDKREKWHVMVTIFMLPEHGAITRWEDQFGCLAQEFFGEPDGWSSFVHQSE